MLLLLEVVSGTIFQITFCISGPYFKFRTYYDLIQQKSDNNIPTMEFAAKRIATVPIYGIIYLTLSHFYYIEVSSNDESFTVLFSVFQSYTLC